MKGQEEVSAVVGGEGVWLVVVGGGVTDPQFGQTCKPQMCRQQAAEQGVDEAAHAHFLCSLAAAQF